MTSNPIALIALSDAATTALENVSLIVADYSGVDDTALLMLSTAATGRSRIAASTNAVLTAEMTRRSATHLGEQGFARKNGWRSPVEMVKAITGAGGIRAAELVRAAVMINEHQTEKPINPVTGQPRNPIEPWLVPVGKALVEGLSTEHASAIRRGLGKPNNVISVTHLSEAAESLCRAARNLSARELATRAREMRDEMDAPSVTAREEKRRSRRSFRIAMTSDGMGKVTWFMDPETNAVVKETYDRITAPKSGGPRFGTADLEAHAERIRSDVRSPAQLASDSMAALLQLGAGADPALLLGSGIPTVHLLASVNSVHRSVAVRPSPMNRSDAAQEPHVHTDACRDNPSRCNPNQPQSPNTVGYGWIDGQDDPVSLETLQRMICAGSTTIITVNNSGQPIDVGREQRLYTRREHRGIAARDGGCLWTDIAGSSECDRPPSWTEIHQVDQWKNDGVKTDIANGVSFCKYHHTMLHQQGWEVLRDGATFWLVPPATLDPKRTPRRIPSRSSAMRAFLIEQAAYEEASNKIPRKSTTKELEEKAPEGNSDDHFPRLEDDDVA